MNDYIIEQLLTIIETGSSEIAKISALKQLSSVDLDSYFKRKSEQEQSETKSEIISESEALKLLEV